MKIIELHGKKIGLIGDPHLGRKFETGVPLDRRGEREASQWVQLEEELNTEGLDVAIIVGDVFDQFAVPNSVVMDFFNVLMDAYMNHDDLHIVVIRGNHDASRDVGKVSSYAILARMIESGDRLIITEDDPEILVFHDSVLRIGLLPWHPFRNSREQAKLLTEQGYEFDMCVGHWDRVTFDDEPHNCIPLTELRPYCKFLVSGHDHNACEYEMGDVKILYTGSMQPYSHGEDQDGEKYITLALEDVRAKVAEDPTFFHDKALRIALKPGEKVDFAIDAWAITTKLIQNNGEDFVDISVQAESFDTIDVISRCLAKHEVPQAIADKTLAMYKERHNAA
ncbi:endonuclease subunit [Achromobacter phage JWF]|uniref:endonuclease subunit n=1 Tax=Achromobacter phage JWF TaxID=1589748 RepID=UPI000588E1A0|nr:endonuclease subunit [Achromobacter phage JWF]AJD82938.1 endonuclease subunit [Achromobacter phage JWF]